MKKFIILIIPVFLSGCIIMSVKSFNISGKVCKIRLITHGTISESTKLQVTNCDLYIDSATTSAKKVEE